MKHVATWHASIERYSPWYGQWLIDGYWHGEYSQVALLFSAYAMRGYAVPERVSVRHSRTFMLARSGEIEDVRVTFYKEGR